MPRIPTYDSPQMADQVTDMPKAASLGDAYQKAKMGAVDQLGVAADAIRQEVDKGKQVAVANYRLQIDQAHAAIQNKVLSMQRADALGATEVAANDWQKVTDDIGSKIGLADVRASVSAYANAKAVQLKDTISRHEQAEVKRLDDENTGTADALDIDNAALNIENPAFFAIAKNNIVTRNTEWAKRNGIPTEGTPEQTAYFVGVTKDKVAKLYFGSIQQLADSAKMPEAEALFEVAKQDKDLTQPALARINDIIKAGKAKQDDGLFQDLWNELDVARRQEVFPSPSKYCTPWKLEALKKSDPVKAATLEHARYSANTNMNVWAELQDTYMHNTPALGKMPFAAFQNKYGRHLNESDWDKAQSMWKDAQDMTVGRAPSSGGSAKRQRMLTQQQVVKDYLIQQNLIPADSSKWSDGDKRYLAATFNAAAAEFDAAFSRKGSALTNPEEYEIIKGALAKEVQIKKTTLGMDWASADRRKKALGIRDTPLAKDAFIPFATIDPITLDDAKSYVKALNLPLDPTSTRGRSKLERMAAAKAMGDRNLYDTIARESN